MKANEIRDCIATVRQGSVHPFRDEKAFGAEFELENLIAEIAQHRRMWNVLWLGDCSTDEEKRIFRSIFGPSDDEERISALEANNAAMRKALLVELGEWKRMVLLADDEDALSERAMHVALIETAIAPCSSDECVKTFDSAQELVDDLHADDDKVLVDIYHHEALKMMAIARYEEGKCSRMRLAQLLQCSLFHLDGAIEYHRKKYPEI